MAAWPGSLNRLVAALGVAALALVTASIAPESTFPGARLLTVSATLLLAAVVWRVLTRRGFGTASAETEPGRDGRPADGRVGLARVAGLLSEPNTVDPRFGRFLALDADRQRVMETEGARRRALGRCPPLLGRVVIVSVFLGQDGRGWSPRQIARSHGSLLRVGRWVERQAMRWGAPVNIEIARTYFATDEPPIDDIDLDFGYEKGRLNSFERHEVERALLRLNRAAIRLGFRHGRHLVEATEAGIKADVVVWLLHPWLAGRSFAVPVDLPNAVAVNLAVCYPVYADLPEPLRTSVPTAADPTSVIHEFFHLFGATDKYNQSLRSFRAGTVTSRDVMRLRESRLAKLRVDRETAREVGWEVPRTVFETKGPPQTR